MLLDLHVVFDPDREPVSESRTVCCGRGVVASWLIDPALLPADWHLEWDERADRLERRAGLPREHAEAVALNEVRLLIARPAVEDK